MDSSILREVGVFALIAIVIVVVFRVQGASLSDALVGGIIGFATGIVAWQMIGLEVSD